MRALLTMWTAVALAVLCAACSHPGHRAAVWGAQAARLGESVAVLGWNMSVSNLRWNADYVLVDIDASVAAPTDPAAPHAKAEDIRFGLYGAVAHPVEATGLGSCEGAKNVVVRMLSAPTLPGPGVSPACAAYGASVIGTHAAVWTTR